MCLVTSFLVMLQPLAVAMTAPTFSNWTTLLAGWAFAPRRTVTVECLRLPERSGMPVRGTDADRGADAATARPVGPRLLV